jgi:hypothetical protein
MIEWYKGIEFEIDPDATLTYSFNWNDWLDDGAGIDSYSIIVDEDDVTVTDVTQAGGIVSLSISGVAEGARVPVTCRITTDEAAPQTDDRTISIVGVAA